MSAKNRDLPDDVRSIIGSADCAGPAREIVVKELESALGYPLPAQYRAFLLAFGAALFHGFEIYGLPSQSDNEPPAWSDIRDALRTVSMQGFSGRLIPISDDGGDFSFFVAVNEGASDSSPVVAYGPGCDGREVAASFFDFIRAASKSGVASILR